MRVALSCPDELDVVGVGIAEVGVVVCQVEEVSWRTSCEGVWEEWRW